MRKPNNKMMEAMSQKKNSALLGKTVFTLTFIAMLVFFWWLLLYDHGIVPAHH